MAEMVPLYEMWTKEVAIDWKNVIENYVEDYHFPIGHPGLSALMEAQYDRESFPGGTMRLSHRMREKPLRSWSAQGYAKFLPVIEHLPEDMRRRWTYFGLYPNVFFDIYPEWLDFFHVLPQGAGRTLIRARSYGFPDDPHTDQLHVVERFTRKDLYPLRYEATIDDPGAYTEPWTVGFDIVWDENGEIQEYICQENSPWMRRLFTEIRDTVDIR
jgi:phenylpropionate dioxygenase-like ring-hydroxylating dioxygenase large terminal subunit